MFRDSVASFPVRNLPDPPYWLILDYTRGPGNTIHAREVICIATIAALSCQHNHHRLPTSHACFKQIHVYTPNTRLHTARLFHSYLRTPHTHVVHLFRSRNFSTTVAVPESDASTIVFASLRFQLGDAYSGLVIRHTPYVWNHLPTQTSSPSHLPCIRDGWPSGSSYPTTRENVNYLRRPSEARMSLRWCASESDPHILFHIFHTSHMYMSASKCGLVFGDICAIAH